MAGSISETKKMLVLSVLQVLEKYSDEEHRMHQPEIIRLIEETTGLTSERGSIRRCLTTLQEAGYPVVFDHGWYYRHTFSDAELNLITDSLLYNPAVPMSVRQELIAKISDMSSDYYVPQALQALQKPYNPEFLQTLDIVHDAMRRHRQIRFQYGNFDVDKKLHMKCNRDGTERFLTVSPYRVVQSGGRHYLIANTEGYDTLSHYRLDRMESVERLQTRMRPLREVEDGNSLLSMPRYLAQHPHMFSGPVFTYQLRCKRFMAGDILDWFGTDTVFRQVTEDSFLAVVRVDAQSMKYWLRQYGEHVELVEGKEETSNEES